MGENRWWLQFDWGDKIEVQIVVVTDETSYTITPDYDFVLGDSGNYKIDTVDATGEFDIPPIYPIDGFSMGRPAGFSSVADSSSYDKEAAPAPEGSDPSALDQADEDVIEEPLEEAALETLSEEPQEEPLDEPYVEPFEEEMTEEEPQEDSSEEDPQENSSEEELQEETSQDNS